MEGFCNLHKNHLQTLLLSSLQHHITLFKMNYSTNVFTEFKTIVRLHLVFFLPCVHSLQSLSPLCLASDTIISDDVHRQTLNSCGQENPNGKLFIKNIFNTHTIKHFIHSIHKIFSSKVHCIEKFLFTPEFTYSSCG